MTAAESYAARFDAAAAQVARLRAQVRVAPEIGTADRQTGGPSASPMPGDPRRAPDPELALLASYLVPADVLIDVGGGSGRLGLPLAQHCRQVINVDPSPDMLAALTAAATTAGITNVRGVQSDWLAAKVAGDVVLAAHVTYFVRDIEPFIERLQAAARRRVLILLYSTLPQAQIVHQTAFHLVFREAAAVAPGYRELVPVLWELGILPEVRVLPEVGVRGVAPTRAAAVTRALRGLSAHVGVPVERDARARQIVDAHFGTLFHPVNGGFRPAGPEDHRGLLVSWEPQANVPAATRAPGC